MEIAFTVGGQRRSLTKEKVIAQLKELEPKRMRAHVVLVEGVAYPVKEAFAHVTGLDVLDFNTDQARRVFRRLGFEVKRMS